MNNYYIYVDKQGKMPILSKGSKEIKSHPYYTRYHNNSPIAYHGPSEILANDISNTKIWDYAKSNFIPITSVPSE